MKTALGTLFLAGALATGGIIGFSGKKDQTQKPPAVVYFYPRANVYYNETDKSYIYIDNSGKWQEHKEVPNYLISKLDKKVLLKNTTKPIWKNNTEDRMIFAASLYAKPSDLKEEPRPEENKTIKPHKQESKASSTTKEKDKPKEKGLTRFFHKIFGKKKD